MSEVDFQQYLEEGRFLPSEEHLLPLTLALYRLVGKGDPVSVSDLACVLKTTPDAVDEWLSELPKSMIDRDKDGAIIAFRGLSQVPANHQFVVEGRQLFIWCVFDALFLPQILEQSAVCETICPTTGQSIVIELTPKNIAASNPAQPVMSIVTPSRDACSENLRGAYCNHVNFFVDKEAYSQWAVNRTDIASVTLEKAQELANLWNHKRYGDLSER